MARREPQDDLEKAFEPGGEVCCAWTSMHCRSVIRAARMGGRIGRGGSNAVDVEPRNRRNRRNAVGGSSANRVGAQILFFSKWPLVKTSERGIRGTFGSMAKGISKRIVGSGSQGAQCVETSFGYE